MSLPMCSFSLLISKIILEVIKTLQKRANKWITKLKVRIRIIKVDPKYLHKSAALYDKYK